MELKDFIQTAVTQIVEGVVAAQAAAATHRAVVNPAVEPGGRGAAARAADGGARVSDIAFDLVVTQAEGAAADGSATLLVAGTSSLAPGDGPKRLGAEHLTRLQFSLPIAFPEQRVKRPMTATLDSEFLQTVDNGDSTWLPPQ